MNQFVPPDVPPPEPVFGGFTVEPSFPADGLGVFVAARVGGTGVAVFGRSVGVDVGVWVFNLPGVSDGAGVAVHGARWNAAWISPNGANVGVAVASHGTMLPAFAVPDVM